MLKLFIKLKINSTIQMILLISLSFQLMALDSDKNAEFKLEGDNFKNLPKVIAGETKVKFWGNVSIQQGTLKINSHEAIIYNGIDGVSKVILTGKPVTMEQVVDIEFGKIDITADEINFMVQDDLILMSGNVIIKSKIQGEMMGEKISMNLKTKEIKGEKLKGQRVKLIIKSKSK